jgi:hypothetical protein
MSDVIKIKAGNKIEMYGRVFRLNTSEMRHGERIKLTFKECDGIQGVSEETCKYGAIALDMARSIKIDPWDDPAIVPFSPDSVDALGMSVYFANRTKLEKLIKGKWKMEIKSKTKFITFFYKGRTVTLCGRNNGNKIEVGYSVYCDHLLDKRKTKTPKEDLSNKIAEGRLKNPIYTVNVDDSPANFILSALEVAKIKIRNGELIIKGIRDGKESNASD